MSNEFSQSGKFLESEMLKHSFKNYNKGTRATMPWQFLN